MSYQIIHTDAVKWAWGQAWLRQYSGELFHAVFCDAPYHLTSINQRFGQPGSAPAQFGKDGAFGRLSKGFMGQDWDGGGVSFDPRTWEGFAECLHPGGFVMTFGGSRTYHRIAVAMEDAGLILHPSIFGYAFGAGFPKATRIDTQVDRAAGAERETVKSDLAQFGINKTRVEQGYRPNEVKNGSITLPSTPLAKTWQGHRYGLQALKPAIEPLIVAQKPYSGRPVDCITATGAGAWNIEGGRVSPNDNDDYGCSPNRADGKRSRNCRGFSWGEELVEDIGIASDSGRWPANLYLQHLPECGAECAEGCPVKVLGEMSGESADLLHSRHNTAEAHNKTVSLGKTGKDWITSGYADSGTAARFFFQSDWSYEVAEQLANANPLFYTAKPSGTEREAGLESLPDSTRHRVNAGGLENEPRFAPVQAKNVHPTVKAIAATKYFSSLLLPPVAYAPRRILIPFAGVGSEMIGAMLAGWEEVVGLEITEKYIPICEARLAWWSQWPGWGQTDVDKILGAVESDPQQRLF